MQEVELKFLEINKEDIEEKLLVFGAKKKYSQEILSATFDAKGYSSKGEKNTQMLRVRQIGDEVIITHKKPLPGKFKNLKETEIHTQSTYQEAIAFIQALGFSLGLEYKKYRTHYEADNAHFEIDEFHGLPAFLEIETQSEEEMIRVCKQLSLDISQGREEPASMIYPEYFN